MSIAARAHKLGLLGSIAAVVAIVVLCLVISYFLGRLWGSFESAPAVELPSPVAAKRLGSLTHPATATALAALPTLRSVKPKPHRRRRGGVVGESQGSPAASVYGDGGSNGKASSGVGPEGKALGSTQTGTQTDSSPTETQPTSPPTETERTSPPTKAAPSRTSAQGTAAR